MLLLLLLLFLSSAEPLHTAPHLARTRPLIDLPSRTRWCRLLPSVSASPSPTPCRNQERRPSSPPAAGSPPRSAKEDRGRLLPLPAAIATEADQHTSAATTATPPPTASTTEAILAAAAAALPTWIRPATSSSQQPRHQRRKRRAGGGGGGGSSGSGTPSSSGSRASLLSSGRQSATLTPALSPTNAAGAGAGARPPAAFSPRGQPSNPGLLDGGTSATAVAGGAGGLASVIPGERSLFAGGGGKGVSSRGGLSPRARPGRGVVGGAAAAAGGECSPLQPSFDDAPRSFSTSAKEFALGATSERGGGGPVSSQEDNSASRRLKETSSFWLVRACIRSER